MKVYILLLLFIIFCLDVASSLSISTSRIRVVSTPRRSLFMTSSSASSANSWNKQIDDANAAQTARDMTGFKLLCKFDGFGVVGMSCGIEFESNFKAVFSRGVATSDPGFWRVIKFEDGREQLEVTCPVLPEWMYFFDIWESSILWRGDLDAKNGLVKNGEVITNKKRFGIFPFQEKLATFEGKVYFPDEELPDVALPKMEDQKFLPPKDFYSPLDMERFPDIFSKEYRQWWFDVEDALVAGNTPPKRPAPFFVPISSENSGNKVPPDLSRVKDGKMSRRRMEQNKGKRGKGF